MSLLGYALGLDVLVVGVEDDPDEPDLTRVYIKARWLNQYVLVGGDDATKIRRAWENPMGHITICRPPDEHVYQDEAS